MSETDLVSTDVLDRVVEIARHATAHNYGRTVLEAKRWRDGVWLTMSSWPRAQEARCALVRNGYRVAEREDFPSVLMVREASR